MRGLLDQSVRDSPVGLISCTRRGDVVVYVDNFTFPLLSHREESDLQRTFLFRVLHPANHCLTVMFTTDCYLRGHVTLNCESPVSVCFATEETLYCRCYDLGMD